MNADFANMTLEQFDKAPNKMRLIMWSTLCGAAKVLAAIANKDLDAAVAVTLDAVQEQTAILASQEDKDSADFN